MSKEGVGFYILNLDHHLLLHASLDKPTLIFVSKKI